MLGDIGKDTVPSLRDWDALGAIMGEQRQTGRDWEKCGGKCGRT